MVLHNLPESIWFLWRIIENRQLAGSYFSFYVNCCSHLKSKNTKLAAQTMYVILFLSNLVYAFISYVKASLYSPYPLHDLVQALHPFPWFRKEHPSLFKQPEFLCVSYATLNIVTISYTIVLYI